MTELFLPRPSALICWPVEFLNANYYQKQIKDPHVTALYFPDVVEAEFVKDDVLAVLRERNSGTDYTLANIVGRAAFGPDLDIPVLRVQSVGYVSLSSYIHKMRGHLDDSGMSADRTYEVNPHITVNLKTFIDYPNQILLRPLELWWQDDKPVVV